MTLLEALGDKIFDFPLEASDYFPDYLAEIFNQYLNLMKAVDDEYSDLIKIDIEQIEKLCKELFDITTSVFKGNYTEANSKFSIVIEYLKQYLLYPNKNVVLQNPTHLFRARRSMDEQFGLTDMFHVPFEKRYTISTSRFSLSGVPCLYLSNSIYTCWEELDRPLFLQMAVSRFEITGKNFMFLDLSDTARKIERSLIYIHSDPQKRLPEHEELIQMQKKLLAEFLLPRFINSYPLIAACYIQVFHKKAHFIPEYIFPQMLMQWIMTQEKIDGIKYFSTKCAVSEFTRFNLEDFLNFAIPVKSFQQKGYCRVMAKHLSLTEPLTFELLSISDPVKATTGIDYDKDIKGKFYGPPIMLITMNSNKPCDYLNTTFGILEHELFTKPVNSLLKL
jgi:hypothetical protein